MSRLDKPLPAIETPVTPEVKGLIQIAHSLSGLVEVHKDFESARVQVEMATGKPICIPGCGLCCKSQTPAAWELEAGYMVSKLYGDRNFRREVTRRAMVWLNSQRNINSSEGIIQAIKTPCPFLKKDSSCLVHEGRPLSCRAYGVTRVPANYCKREKGNGELSTSWAIFDGPDMHELKESVETLYERIKDDRMGRYTFLPILILVEQGIKVGPVPVAKLPLSMLWQEQVDNVNQSSVLALTR